MPVPKREIARIQRTTCWERCQVAVRKVGARIAEYTHVVTRGAPPYITKAHRLNMILSYPGYPYPGWRLVFTQQISF